MANSWGWLLPWVLARRAAPEHPLPAVALELFDNLRRSLVPAR